jgi:hypothetical protein|tara:strand:- start:26 stop:535 length:510 start_codon:yes stop_codon:yes gene_type:complete
MIEGLNGLANGHLSRYEFSNDHYEYRWVPNGYGGSGDFDAMFEQVRNCAAVEKYLYSRPELCRFGAYVNRSLVITPARIDILSGIGLKKRMDVSSIHRPSVYLLYSGDEIVYVGQSIKPFVRIDTHLCEGRKEFDSFRVMRCRKERLIHWETKLINALKPKYNKTHNAR